MKNTIFLAAAFVIYSAAQAQDTTQTNTDATMGTVTDSAKKLNAYGSYSTRDSIAAKYKLLPMPAPLTLEKTFPVLGSYQLNTPAAAPTDATVADATTTTDNSVATGTEVASPMVTITLDSVNKGMVWIEGMPQGKIKAYLRKSPSTYRIIPQETETGTSIPEGTLIFDSATNVLNIALGAPYDEVDPASVFTVSEQPTPEETTTEVKAKTKNAKTKTVAKAKPKLEFFTATKVVAPEDQQQSTTTDGFEDGLQQAQQSNNENQ